MLVIVWTSINFECTMHDSKNNTQLCLWWSPAWFWWSPAWLIKSFSHVSQVSSVWEAGTSVRCFRFYAKHVLLFKYTFKMAKLNSKQKLQQGVLWHWISLYSESEVFSAFCILSEVYSLWHSSIFIVVFYILVFSAFCILYLWQFSRCIQSRKYFEDSVSCRKCILCDIVVFS